MIGECCRLCLDVVHLLKKVLNKGLILIVCNGLFLHSNVSSFHILALRAWWEGGGGIIEGWAPALLISIFLLFNFYTHIFKQNLQQQPYLPILFQFKPVSTDRNLDPPANKTCFFLFINNFRSNVDFFLSQ